MRIAGFVLIVLGVISLAVGGISYTKREKVLDIGPIQATATASTGLPSSAAAKAALAQTSWNADEVRSVQADLSVANPCQQIPAQRGGPSRDGRLAGLGAPSPSVIPD